LQEKLQESWDAETAAEVEDSPFFKALDTSGDGLLDFDEFVSGMQKLLKEQGGSISQDTLETHFMVGVVQGRWISCLGTFLKEERVFMRDPSLLQCVLETAGCPPHGQQQRCASHLYTVVHN
jgi:hypothetical protein